LSFIGTIFQVMIASPSDVVEERKIAKEVIYKWNSTNSVEKKIVLLPVLWELDTSPKIGETPQTIINKQILESSDVLVVIFWNRIGTPTGTGISGTIEEVEKHVKSKKPAMLYFSKIPILAEDIDHNQHQALKEYKKRIQKESLYHEYSTVENFEKEFYHHLSLLINREKYFKQPLFIESGRVADDREINVSSLIDYMSDEERELLIKASEDTDGEVLKLHYMGGWQIQSGETTINKDCSARTLAKWETAIRLLVEKGFLIKRNTNTGELYSITSKGYELADLLKK